MEKCKCPTSPGSITELCPGCQAEYLEEIHSSELPAYSANNGEYRTAHGITDEPKSTQKDVGGGIKHDDGKPPMELLSHQAAVQIARVFGYGAKKYARYNYKKGMAWSRVIGAAMRHLGAFNSGEDKDPETGESHIAHLGACVYMLLDYISDHPELDDRYKKP